MAYSIPFPWNWHCLSSPAIFHRPEEMGYRNRDQSTNLIFVVFLFICLFYIGGAQTINSKLHSLSSFQKHAGTERTVVNPNDLFNTKTLFSRPYLKNLYDRMQNALCLPYSTAFYAIRLIFSSLEMPFIEPGSVCLKPPKTYAWGATNISFYLWDKGDANDLVIVYCYRCSKG